jgi:hypothetical protein
MRVKELDELVWEWFMDKRRHPNQIRAAYESYYADVRLLAEERETKIKATEEALAEAREREESYLLAVGSAKSETMRGVLVAQAETAHEQVMSLAATLAILNHAAHEDRRKENLIRSLEQLSPQMVDRLRDAPYEDRREALYRCKVSVVLYDEARTPRYEISWLHGFVHSHESRGV